MSGATKSANGSSPSSGSALAAAVTRHHEALIRANTRPDGMMAINPMQMFCDLALAETRLEVLFEFLRDEGTLDPAVLTVKLRDKLLAQAEELEKFTTPQIAIAAGRVPRNDG